MGGVGCWWGSPCQNAGCWETQPGPFLHARRVSILCLRPRIACTAEEPEPVSTGMLLDVAKYLGSLQYNVWKKMLDIITVGEVLGLGDAWVPP